MLTRIHSQPPPAGRARWALVLPVVFALWACDTPLEPVGEMDVPTVLAPAPPVDVGESAGNNLSFPVIWSDGVAKTLRGTYLTEVSDGASFVLGTTEYWVQNDPGNEWQAESLDAVTAGSGEVAVDLIDWGDNLEARSWPFGSQVRVETVLYLNVTPTMTAYTMQIEDETVSGLGEVWGTDFVKYDSPEATVYSGMARLVIQKLTKDRDDPTLALTWNTAESRWDGDVGGVLFTGGVWDAVDGPGGYSAEINGKGMVIYGYNWVTKRTALGAGDYRLTFVLDSNSPIANQNTVFDAGTAILEPVEEEEVTIEEDDDGPDLGGGTAVVLHADNLTYIDVRLTLRNGKAGNSGKGAGQGKKNAPGTTSDEGKGSGNPDNGNGAGSGKALVKGKGR